MTRGKYDPTEAPGQTRVRSQQQVVTTPMGQTFEVSIREQSVIRLESGAEKVLEDLGQFSVALTAEELAQEFPVLDPQTDTDTGLVTDGYAAMAGYYSFVRKCQKKRDIQTLLDQVGEQ